MKVKQANRPSINENNTINENDLTFIITGHYCLNIFVIVSSSTSVFGYLSSDKMHLEV